MCAVQDALRGKKRLFVCGLALDFCVLDTCLNAKQCGVESVHAVLDAARAAHIDGVGSHGSGFISDPQQVMSKIRDAGVNVATFWSLIPKPAAPKLADVVSKVLGFPASLGPFGLARACKMSVTFDADQIAYRVEQGKGSSKDLADLQSLGFTCSGRCSPVVPLPARWPAAPATAKRMCWAYPMAGMAELSYNSRLAFLKLTASPDLRFAAYGGFLLLDDAGAVVAVQTVGGGADLAFGAPQAWRPEFTEQLEGAGRFQPVTLPSLLRDGATHFCWLNAGEELKAGDASWMPSKEGAFLYRRKDAAPLFFPVRA